jgi:CheY-like chemotaxis protein
MCKKFQAMFLIDIYYDHNFYNLFDSCTLQDVCMPVMDGLQATQLIRSSEETGNWDAAKQAGVEQSVLGRDYEYPDPSTKRIPIVAVSSRRLEPNLTC